MGKGLGAWLGAIKPTKRRLIQVYAALLYNANLKGFIQGQIYSGPVKNICVPGFNCYSCPGAVGACPLGAIQNALASSGNRAPYYVLGILMLFGVILGRTVCGWLCPLGLIQELFYKIPTPKIRKNRMTRVMSWFKYVVLAVFVVGIPLVYSVQQFPVPGFCKYICPAGTFEGAIALLANPVNADKFSMLNILFTRKFIIMVLIFASCVFAYRAFCRFLCPLGAIYGLFARISVLGVKVEASKCTRCGRCVAKCKMDIRKVGDHECIHCGECIKGCPTKAISFKHGRATHDSNDVPRIKPQKLRSFIAWALAIAVLLGALWYFNLSPNANESSAPIKQDVQIIDDTPVGYDVGMRCPAFTVPLYGNRGESFTLTGGKVTVINFWATWCTPCVGELPHFQELYEAYSDEIALVAIHSNLVTDDVQAFLDKEGYSIPFALDENGSVIQSLGGSTMLPMTVIVDKSGKIVYNKVGSVTYALLDSIIAPLAE